MSVNLTVELQTYFGHDHFRPGQRESLELLTQGEPVLALMPTGSGKSLIYQWFAKSQPELVLVVSPLIALMQDQTAKARAAGIDASFINSSLSKEEREKRQKTLGEGGFRLLFVTPERFRKSEFRDALARRKVGLFAVDEAHCVSMWGHDFRPDYSRLGEIRAELGNPLTVALTATATPEVQKDILKSLHLENARIIGTALDRPNLALNVRDAVGLEDKIQMLTGQLEDRPHGAVIVYFSLIQTLREVSRELSRLGFSHWTYHGDLPADLRRKHLKKFMEEKSPLMLATPAFGLGIDRPDVRRLVHMELPGSLEAYFQEVGRAGRDGHPAEAWLYYDEEEDTAIQMEFLKWGNPEPEFLRRVWTLINDRRGEVDQGGFDFLREQMSFKNKRDFRVEAAVNILERWGCLEKSETPFPWVAVEPPEERHFKAEKTPDRLKNLNMKLLQMLRWAKDDQTCRMQRILEYFGHASNPCGVCDVCRELA